MFCVRISDCFSSEFLTHIYKKKTFDGIKILNGPERNIFKKLNKIKQIQFQNPFIRSLILKVMLEHTSKFSFI
jgi:hypothetical protein